jgi:hypothetical protein
MGTITRQSTLLEVAALVSDALRNADIEATLCGGSAVTIYSENAYLSRDLDFVTSALIEDLSPALEPLGFRHTGVPRLSQFHHPLIEWYLEFPASPLAFGHLRVDHKDCAVMDLAVGKLRIITPTQSVMDRLAAAFAWHDAQSREQAILVAARQEVDWDALEIWFANEGESDAEFTRFRDAVEAAKEE